MFLDEQMSIFTYRKMLKVLFKMKDKTSNAIFASFINLFIKEIKNEMNEIFVNANLRKKE